MSEEAVDLLCGVCHDGIATYVVRIDEQIVVEDRKTVISVDRNMCEPCLLSPPVYPILSIRESARLNAPGG